jgi:hypothetical protein
VRTKEAALGLKQESFSADASQDMDRVGGAGVSSTGEAGSPGGRFACPSCGSMLRDGAILCPQCGNDFRGEAKVDPNPEFAPPAVAEPLWGPPRPATTPDDRKPAILSVVFAVIGLLTEIAVLPLLARQIPPPYVLMMVVGWAAFFLTVYAIVLARRAERRIRDTRDKRGLMMAQFGLILGFGIIAFMVLSFFLSFLPSAKPQAKPQPDVPSDSAPQPLQEPVPVPADLGFVAVPDPFSDPTDRYHGYESTTPMSEKQAYRAMDRVMAYYERGLADNWIVVDREPAGIMLKDSGSTRGILVGVGIRIPPEGPIITLEVRSTHCPTADSCF